MKRSRRVILATIITTVIVIITISVVGYAASKSSGNTRGKNEKKLNDYYEINSEYINVEEIKSNRDRLEYLNTFKDKYNDMLKSKLFNKMLLELEIEILECENKIDNIEEDLKKINNMIDVDIEEAEKLLLDFKEQYPDENLYEIEVTINNKLVINQKLKDIESLVEVYVDSAEKLLVGFKEKYPDVDVSKVQLSIDERRKKIEY